MKIALIGSRGIPARYSGFEQFYEQFAVRLVKRGHNVTVYNRSHFIKDIKHQYHGVRIISLPSIPTKHLDTITHTFLSTLHALSQRYDIVYYCIVGNSPLVWIPRIIGTKTLINVDGEDWAREKWSGFSKIYQKWCERVACKAGNVVIADAKGILVRYHKLYNHQSIFVPYGANIEDNRRYKITTASGFLSPQKSGSFSNISNHAILKKWNLKPNDYIFYVGRLVPENAIDLLIKSYKRLKTKKKLVIVGDAPYADNFKKELHELAKDDHRIVFTGYVFGDDYAQLSANAYFYVQPAGIDGTRPALLDQMGFGNCVIVRNSIVNMEVIGDCGCFFDKERLEESLAEVMQGLLDDPNTVESYRAKVTSRIKNYYNWEWITAFYEDLFFRLKNGRLFLQYDEFLTVQRSLERF
jgi:glycosyltransferase involved in cell wall biosynthesis